MSSVHVDAFQALGNAEFMRSIWQRYDALAADGDINSTSGTGVFTFFVSVYTPVHRHLAFFLARRLCADAGRGCAPRAILDAIFVYSQFR
jgi:hypothetical protein